MFSSFDIVINFISIGSIRFNGDLTAVWHGILGVDGKIHDTNRRKLGAILGDRTETGCNSVTSPGTLMGPDSIVYPGISVAGGIYSVP